jgi:hypothetical protein
VRVNRGLHDPGMTTAVRERSTSCATTRRAHDIAGNIVQRYAMLTGSSGGDEAETTGDHLGDLRGVRKQLHIPVRTVMTYVIGVAFYASDGHYCFGDPQSLRFT